MGRRERRAGGPGPVVPALVALLVTVGAVRLLDAGPSGMGVPTWLDRLVTAAGSLSGGGGIGVAHDGLDGAPGSGGPGYTFARVQPDGATPVTWPCEGTIAVEVNPDGAPRGYEQAVDAAIERVNAASGFTVEVVGETSDRDFLERGRGPVLLGFADAAEVDLLDGDAAGFGGATSAQDLGGGRLTAVGGVVALDTDVVTEDTLEYAEVILLHELAHVLGLGHTDVSGELMRAAGSGQRDFGPGDLAGLAHLRAAACS